MNANINDDELRLLTYLHEHAKGCGNHFQLDPEVVRNALEADEEMFRKSLSYLDQHGLAGMVTIDTTGFGDPVGGSFHLQGIYLTGVGEDYMRDLESQPGLPKRLTMKALKEGGAIIKEVAIKILTAHLTGQPHG